MERFYNLWIQIRYSEAFQLLPEWLRDPPGVYLLGAVVLLLPIWGLWHFLKGRRLVSTPESRRVARKSLRREIRTCRREGDHLGAGRRYEALGKPRAALKAYRRGGHLAEATDLLMRTGKIAKAKASAREGEEWALYADLCEADGELAEAAVAYERAGHAYAAAGCYERAGMPNEAAHCYLRADMHSKALELLMQEGVGAPAETLETTLRSALQREGGGAPDAREIAAVRRCAQLWIEEGEPERAYRLAIDSGQTDVAIPIARDHLAPRTETAEDCSAAGAHLVAAEIYQRLGDRRREALARAENAQERGEPAEAARFFEIAEEWDLAAEQWAATGESHRAAELFAKSGNFETAAQLFAAAGDTLRQQDMMARASAVTDARELLTGTDSQRQTEPSRPRSMPAETNEEPSPAPDLAPGDRYRLGEELGRGGMGVVYRAEDCLLKRPVAYKVLLQERLADPEEAERLLAEARAAARLSHPNIVQIYDAGRAEYGFFVVMELVEGETFAKLLESRKLSIGGAVRVGRQVCAALAHAHERHLIHRDLKPSNLIWTAGRRVKLTDFGLARAFDAAAGNVVTRPAGTPYYMAPEQILGEAIGPRTDIYSFGCVFYELLTRRGPFGGGSSIRHHLKSQPDDPRTWRRELPEALAALVLSCLRKEPGRRPASAKELGRQLAEAMI